MSEEDKIKWLRQFLGMSSALVLNVAGSRESNKGDSEFPSAMEALARALWAWCER